MQMQEMLIKRRARGCWFIVLCRSLWTERRCWEGGHAERGHVSREAEQGRSERHRLLCLRAVEQSVGSLEGYAERRREQNTHPVQERVGVGGIIKKGTKNIETTQSYFKKNNSSVNGEKTDSIFKMQAAQITKIIS